MVIRSWFHYYYYYFQWPQILDSFKIIITAEWKEEWRNEWMNEWMNSILELEWRKETALVGFGYITKFNWNDIMAMNDFS